MAPVSRWPTVLPVAMQCIPYVVITKTVALLGRGTNFAKYLVSRWLTILPLEMQGIQYIAITKTVALLGSVAVADHFSGGIAMLTLCYDYQDIGVTREGV